MTQQESLTPRQRSDAQKAIIRGNLHGRLSMALLSGQIAVLYAKDVLGFSGKQAGALMAILPLMILLRFPWIQRIKRHGLVRTLRMTVVLMIVMTVVLIALPAHLTTFWVFMALLVILRLIRELGFGVVWQPILREVTTAEDRGRFFARMRFWFTGLSSVVLGCLPFLLGDKMDEWEYKGLLMLLVVLFVNQFYWSRRIPDVPVEEDEPLTRGLASLKKTFHIIRHSQVLRTPLLIRFLTALTLCPLLVVYLKCVLHMPTSIVAAFIFMDVIGGTLSFLFWGRLADTLGFRSYLNGILILFAAINVPLLLASPFPAGMEFRWAALTQTQAITVAALLFFGFARGALLAGRGIALTSVMHFYSKRSDAIEAMNIFQACLMLTNGAMSLLIGFMIDDWAVPWGNYTFFNGAFHFDIYKGFMLFIAAPLSLLTIFSVMRLRDVRPYYTVGDFFQSLTTGSLRSIVAGRNVYHGDEGRRQEAARKIGIHANPMGIEPLLKMLSDTSYDVKVEAIRSLARTGSPLAGEKLLKLLESPEKLQLADHAAWALGELRYERAFDTLRHCLEAPYPGRVRAMAARALGKLDNPDAVPNLIALARDSSARPHSRTSACIALLRMGDMSDPNLFFEILVDTEDREARYEIVDALCHILAIPNDWLLRYTSDAIITDALREYIARQSDSWRAERAAISDAVNSLDAPAIRALIAAQLPHLTPEQLPCLEALEQTLDRIGRWHATAALAAAWLLLREE
jgi:HEAT repeat protein/MFS family permease